MQPAIIHMRLAAFFMIFLILSGATSAQAFRDPRPFIYRTAALSAGAGFVASSLFDESFITSLIVGVSTGCAVGIAAWSFIAYALRNV